MWYWRRPLRAPWTARRSNQSILKEINHEFSSEGLMLKLKFQYFGYLMWRADSLKKTLMLGKTKLKQWQRMKWLDSIMDSMVVNFSKSREIVEDRSLRGYSPWGCKESDMTQWLNNNRTYLLMHWLLNIVRNKRGATIQKYINNKFYIDSCSFLYRSPLFLHIALCLLPFYFNLKDSFWFSLKDRFISDKPH